MNGWQSMTTKRYLTKLSSGFSSAKDGGAHRESQIYPVHRKCHRMVTAKEALARAETRATVKKHYGIKTPKGRPMPGTRASGLKRGFDGVVRKR
jgi:5-methylcytosine-specific restriction protein A